MGEMPLPAKAVAQNTIEIHCFLGQKWYSNAVPCHSVALHLKATIPFYFKVV